MNRITLFLLFLLALMGLSLIYVEQLVRTKFVVLERMQTESRQLEMEWARLQYEQSFLSKPSRVAEIANNKLQMKLPLPQNTLYLSLSEVIPFVVPFIDKPEQL